MPSFTSFSNLMRSGSVQNPPQTTPRAPTNTVRPYWAGSNESLAQYPLTSTSPSPSSPVTPTPLGPAPLAPGRKPVAAAKTTTAKSTQRKPVATPAAPAPRAPTPTRTYQPVAGNPYAARADSVRASSSRTNSTTSRTSSPRGFRSGRTGNSPPYISTAEFNTIDQPGVREGCAARFNAHNDAQPHEPLLSEGSIANHFSPPSPQGPRPLSPGSIFGNGAQYSPQGPRPVTPGITFGYTGPRPLSPGSIFANGSPASTPKKSKAVEALSRGVGGVRKAAGAFKRKLSVSSEGGYEPKISSPIPGSFMRGANHDLTQQDTTEPLNLVGLEVAQNGKEQYAQADHVLFAARAVARAVQAAEAAAREAPPPPPPPPPPAPPPASTKPVAKPATKPATKPTAEAPARRVVGAANRDTTFGEVIAAAQAPTWTQTPATAGPSRSTARRPPVYRPPSPAPAPPTRNPARRVAGGTDRGTLFGDIVDAAQAPPSPQPEVPYKGKGKGRAHDTSRPPVPTNLNNLPNSQNPFTRKPATEWPPRTVSKPKGPTFIPAPVTDNSPAPAGLTAWVPAALSVRKHAVQQPEAPRSIANATSTSSLAASLAAEGHHRASFVADVKCSQCGHMMEAEAVEMHRCGGRTAQQPGTESEREALYAANFGRFSIEPEPDENELIVDTYVDDGSTTWRADGSDLIVDIYLGSESTSWKTKSHLGESYEAQLGGGRKSLQELEGSDAEEASSSLRTMLGLNGSNEDMTHEEMENQYNGGYNQRCDSRFQG